MLAVARQQADIVICALHRGPNMRARPTPAFCAFAHALVAAGADKDITTGLVDFRALREGRVVYLCWRLGEPCIGYWHELDAGFAGRRPLEERTRACLTSDLIQLERHAEAYRVDVHYRNAELQKAQAAIRAPLLRADRRARLWRT